MRTRLLLALVLAPVLCAGCASWKAVEPWEKGYLARPDMGLDGDRLAEAYREHIYFSKESASGGNGVGGGGCGCN